MLAVFLLLTQSVMGVAMRASSSIPNHGDMQISMADDAKAKAVHARALEENASCKSALCPMKQRVQNAFSLGCGGCAACCSAVSVLDWRPITNIHRDLLAFLVPKPATFASSPPFRPPKRS